MRRFHLPLVFLLSLLVTPGCGVKGPLQLPLVLVPQKVETLEAFQRGSRIILEWTNPEAYIDGRPLAGVGEVEVWIYEKSGPALTGAPAPSAEEFEAGARRIDVLDETGKPVKSRPARSRNRIETQPKKAAPPKEFQYFYPLAANDLKEMNLTFGLKVKDDEKERLSEFSNLATVRPQPLPGPPSNVRAAVFADRIEVRWDAPAASFGEPGPASLKGYNVYKIDREGKSERLNSTLVTEFVFADKDFLFGQTCLYIVRAAASSSEPFLESDDSPAVGIPARDLFPPTAPSGLSAAAGPDFITLIWNMNREKDFAGYHVWRKEAGRETFICLTKPPLVGNTYTDRAVEKGKRYEYAVTAVDEAGNESPKSAIVSETIRDP